MLIPAPVVKVMVIAVPLLVALVFAREKIRAWFRTNATALGEASAIAFVSAFVAWLCFYALFEFGDWLVPGIFGRQPSGFKVYVACAFSAGMAVMWIRAMDSKADKRTPEQRVRDGREFLNQLRKSE